MSETPLDVRVSGVHLPRGFGADARALLGRRLGRFATHIERATVRFEDVNGPRGGVDTVCRIQLTVSGRPAVLVQRKAVDAPAALRRSATAVTRAMDRSVGRAGLRTPLPTRARPGQASPRRSLRRATRSPEEGSQAERRADRSPRDVVRGGYKLEESAGRPSRKSTRKSAIRAKSGSKLARRQKRRVRSPKARATRARAEQPRGMSGRA